MMQIRILTAVVLLSILPYMNGFYIRNEKWIKKTQKCPDPYQKCSLGKDGMINVHIAPHTHDDVG